MDFATEQSDDAACEELFNGHASATERPAEKHKLVAWARDAEAVLKAWGLGIKGIDGSDVFFHSPSRPMNVERQKQAFIRAGVYHAIEISAPGITRATGVDFFLYFSFCDVLSQACKRPTKRPRL